MVIALLHVWFGRMDTASPDTLAVLYHGSRQLRTCRGLVWLGAFTAAPYMDS